MVPSRGLDDYEEEQTGGSNPLKFIERTLRGRWKIACSLAAALGLVGLITGYFLQKPSYQSTGIVQVSANRPGIMYEDRDDSRLRLFDAFVSAEAAYLTSRPVLERALGESGIADLGWSPTADNVRRLYDAIDVNAKGGLITVACSSTVATEAAAMANSLLDAYSNMHVEHLRREESVRERQLAIREAELLVKLEGLEGRIKAVGQEYGVQSIAAAHVRKIAQIEEVDLRVAELATTVASREAADSLSEVDTGDVEIKRLVVLDHAMADMLFERTKRAARIASLPDGLAPSHPSVVQAKKALASIDAAVEDRRAQLATLGTTGALTKAGKNAEEDSLEGLRALLTRLRSRVQELRGEAVELNARLIELEFLDGEREQVRNLLDQTRNVLEQVRVESQNTLPGTIEIRARGSVPAQPAKDKRKVMAAVGCVAGAGAGFVGVLVFGMLLGMIRYSDELEAALPDLKLAGVLPEHDGDHESDGQYQYAVYRLRNELQLAYANNCHSRVIVVTSSKPDSGGSSTAKALAESLAQANARTVLVDADLLHPSLTESLSLAGNAGVREALKHDRLNGEICSLDSKNLFALPSGHDSGIHDQHVSHVALRRLVTRLREEFEFVIIDAGAIRDRLVARLAAAEADQVLLVAACKQTAKEVVQAKQILASTATDLRLVFNRSLPDDPSAVLSESSQFMKQRFVGKFLDRFVKVSQ
ncbi:MAG: GumC family protein [Aureliella sp.]